MKTVEICTSVEWLEVFSNIDFDGIENIKDASNLFIDALANELIDAGFKVFIARRQYATCHGWNNANTFEFKLGPVASSDYLTNDECGMIQECIDLAEENMREEMISK